MFMTFSFVDQMFDFDFASCHTPTTPNDTSPHSRKKHENMVPKLISMFLEDIDIPNLTSPLYIFISNQVNNPKANP